MPSHESDSDISESEPFDLDKVMHESIQGYLHKLSTGEARLPPTPDPEEEEPFDFDKTIKDSIQGLMTRLSTGEESAPPPLPAPRPRTSASESSEQKRKEQQCQHCFKSRGEGAKLSKCSACKIATYCSKECQKNNWSVHKAKCKINQRMQALRPSVADKQKLLRAFTTQHRKLLREVAPRSLAVWDDLTRCERDILIIYLRRRPDSKRAETAFYAYEADIMQVSELPPVEADEMREQMRIVKAEAVRLGGIGAVFVLLQCPDEEITNVLPTGFDDEIYEMKDKDPMAWKERLLKHMNEGIVL